MRDPRDEEPGGTGLGLHRSQSIPSEVYPRVTSLQAVHTGCDRTTMDTMLNGTFSYVVEPIGLNPSRQRCTHDAYAYA
jgi:hypothetical protein